MTRRTETSLDPTWEKLVRKLPLPSLGLSLAALVATISGGPAGLLATLGVIGAVGGLTRRVFGKSYVLPDQTPDLAKLRSQLKNPDDVLVAHFLKHAGKLHVVAVGDRREPYRNVPKGKTLSLQAVVRAAGKDSQGKPLVVFFGRSL